MEKQKILARVALAAVLGLALFVVSKLAPESLKNFVTENGSGVLGAVLFMAAAIIIVLLVSLWERTPSKTSSPQGAIDDTFLLAMKGASDGLWVWDIAKDEVKITPRINEVLGTDHPLEGITSKQLFSTFHPEDRAGLTEEMVRHMRGETDFFVYEYRAMQPDGSLRWVEDRGVAERDENGKAVRIGGSVTEITYRKEAEDQILKSEQLLQSVINNTPAVVYIKDSQYRYLLVNQKFHEIFGLSPDQVSGKTDYDIFPARIAHQFRANDEKVFKDGGVQEVEETAPHKDGEHTYISGKFPLLNDQGKIYALCGISTDITDRKRAETELARHQTELETIVAERTALLTQSQERFKDYAEIGSDWFWETGSDHIYTHISSTIKDITGMEPEETYTRSRRDMSSTEDMEKYPEKWAAHFADLDAHRPFENFEYIHNAPNGKKLHFRISGRPFFSTDGKFAGYRGVGSDITDEKRAALALQEAKEEADRANRAKSKFLSGMSHELRTPLNGILGFAQLLELETDNPLTKQQTSYANSIRKAGEHLLDLINEVLDLAKIESGGLMISLESFDPTDLLNECVELVAPTARDAGIRLVNAVDPQELDSFVFADRTRLKQILVNLLSNAVKYNRVNGSVTLSVRKTGTNYYRFKINDTGLGIPAEKIDEIFKPFTRLEVPGGATEGTGIGLAITKNLVELISGKIGVESTFGEGSTFWVDLPMDTNGPIHKTKVESDTKPVPNSLGTNGQKLILYVEDNPDNQNLMKNILGRIPDVKLILAETGEEGIKEAKIRRPDLILLDINLPGMDGIETLKVIKSQSGMKGIPILALSAAAMQDDIDKGMKAGFDDYLTKPLNIKATLTAISKALKD